MDFFCTERTETERFREMSLIRVDLVALSYGRDVWELWREHLFGAVSSHTFDLECVTFNALGL